MNPRRLAIIASGLRTPGRRCRGVTVSITNLVDSLLSSGVEVDILRLRHNNRGKKPTSEQLRELPPDRFRVEAPQPGLRIFHFGTRTKREGLRAVKGYLVSERPAALLASRGHRENIIASCVKFDPAFSGLRIALNVRNADYANMGMLKRLMFRWALRRYYARADLVIAISNGLAQGLQQLSGLSGAHFRTIYNPMLTPELFAKATEPVDHPWFQVDAGVPVILGAGVFCEQKDFATLIRAFARLRALRPTRLVILGNGPERPALQKLVQSLGIDKDVDMPGFVDNPYSYMARANLFTLSSAWEGFGNVLAEAMGLGTPLVATDCPNGPSEILDGGRLGRLVPVGDDKALAKAMEETLLSPPRPEILRDAARRFAVDDIAAQYREALGI